MQKNVKHGPDVSGTPLIAVSLRPSGKPDLVSNCSFQFDGTLAFLLVGFTIGIDEVKPLSRHAFYKLPYLCFPW